MFSLYLDGFSLSDDSRRWKGFGWAIFEHRLRFKVAEIHSVQVVQSKWLQSNIKIKCSFIFFTLLLISPLVSQNREGGGGVITASFFFVYRSQVEKKTRGKVMSWGQEGKWWISPDYEEVWSLFSSSSRLIFCKLENTLLQIKVRKRCSKKKNSKKSFFEEDTLKQNIWTGQQKYLHKILAEVECQNYFNNFALNCSK